MVVIMVKATMQDTRNEFETSNMLATATNNYDDGSSDVHNEDGEDLGSAGVWRGGGPCHWEDDHCQAQHLGDGQDTHRTMKKKNYRCFV